ncbi:uncharacterized protein LOC129294533 [Prosopis cineraria]|uniref:uncharacterized protein LOC129294533 n=1 Tax=Prosopis cineraria TaxID=364024 RepID=UPI00241077BE|nr:uncharacterized protein LOC129294533 [Prosopis cineraria]
MCLATDKRYMEESSKKRLNRAQKVSALIRLYATKHLCKEPQRNSEYTGYLWVNEILEGHPVRCYEMFRMEPHMFHQLCNELTWYGLKDTRRMRVQEMVAIFLNTIGHGLGNRMAQERFQHSGETIHRHFHEVLMACSKLAMEYIKPQDRSFHHVSNKIENDKRYWPFFKNAIGAIDGTHIPCVVPASEKSKYIGRKGISTQNVMAVCDWDMCFTFVLAGWEGTAHDARIFQHTLTTRSMNFPHPPSGKYYLVDAGYPTPNGYLGPYRRERYHLPDFRRSTGFANNNEIFNYFYSSLRCTIERTFGVWKKRFAILRNMPSYDYDIQVQIVVASMAIHNFIKRRSNSDADFMRHEREDQQDYEDQEDHGVDEYSFMTSFSSSMISICDIIRDQLVYDHLH